MAKAYLGKISALVTANTSDFNSKLNASANELRNFAKSVQSNITRTTQDANRAFSAILTPLQKFEASLRAASSMRLSFKGFQGAIKGVEELKARLATLKDSQVNLVVNASGMKSLTDFRNAIGDITNKDIRVLTDVGGIEKLRELRSIIETEDGRTIATQVRVKDVDLNRIIAKFERIDKRQIDAVIRVLGEQDLEAAVVKQQQLASAAKQVAEPLAAAVAQFGKLSTEVQTAFIPALNRAQDATQNLQSDIEAGVRIGQERFRGLEAQVLRTAEAIDRLSEAAATVSTIRTGRELEFQQPRAQAALTAARAVSGEATGNVALNPRAFEASQVAIKRESDALVGLIALRESANEQGERGTASVIQAQIDTRTASLERQTAEYRRLIAAEKELQRIVVDARTDISDKIQAARLAQEEAAFRERAAEQTERQAAAANRVLAADLRRREALREQQDNFGAGIDLGPQQAPEQLFGRRQRTRDSELGRTRELERQFQALPDDVQASLAAEAKALNNIATSAKAGAAGVETLATANDRMASAIGKANASLDQQNSRAKLLDDFKRRFADFDEVLQTRAVSAFTAELEVMERAALSLGANVRGPVVSAMNAYRDAVQQAMDGNTFDSPATKASLKSLRDEFIAAAKQAGMSADEIAAALKRANSASRGDIGRLGVDKASLALNQLAFAIDDFFSSTGGLEFKLRAVSNNITQLGFIVGGTTGLFVSLGAVVAGQVVAGIAKFVFETDKADAALSALNAALEANQRNVEQLAESYRRLADEIAKATLSPRDNLRRDRDRQRDEITRQRRASEEEAFASLSPAVATVRGERELLKKQQQESNSVEERVRIAKQIRENLKREQGLLSDRGAREARDLVSQAAEREAAAQRVRLTRARARRELGSAPLPGEDVDDLERTVAVAEARRDAARGRRLPGATTSARTREQLSTLQESLSRAEQSRADLVNALPETPPGSSVTRVDELDETIRKLRDRIEVVSAVLGGQLATELIDANFRIQDALSQAAESLSSIGVESALAKTRDRLSRELTAIADELASVSDPARAEALKKQQDELEKQSVKLRSAASSVEQFAAVIDRVAKQLSDTVLQEVEGRANQARREANAARGAVDAGVANVPAFNRPRVAADQRRRADQANEDRRRAEADVQRAQAGQQEFEQRRRRSVQQFEASAAGGRLGQEAQGLVRQRDQAQAVLDSETATVAEQQQAAETLARVNARLEQLFQNSSLGVALADFADGLDAASQAAAELDRQIREQRASADRGRELTLTPGERAAEELNQQIADIREYATRAAEESSGLPEDVAKIRNRMNEAIGRAEEDMMRQVAPMITGMADSVRNAVMQGPSRAALNASDVTTTQGQQELNRLLRGDDPAREVDLVALQREANRLLEVIANKDNPVAG